MLKLLCVTIAGICALVIAMGIGRFAYTPIFPLMQETLHFSNVDAGYIAAGNYFGYLLGALLGSRVQKSNKQKVFRVSLVINILCNGAMALTTSLVGWAVYRFISGISSGIVFVLASSMILDFLASKNRSAWSGLFYSGVGIGIVISGLLVPFLNQLADWRGAWLGLMLLCLLLSPAPLFWTEDSRKSVVSDTETIQTQQDQNASFFYWLLASYGLEGLGYIITGTFLVDIAMSSPATKEVSSLSWVIAGIGAIPSTLIWAWVGNYFGHVKALVCAYLLQAIGIVIPVLQPGTTGILISAFLFGGTFMGITTLATSLARNISDQSNRSIGYLTACYGIGQILGPIVGALLEQQTHSYNWSLIGASIIIFVGGALLVVGRYASSAQTIQVSRKGGFHVE